MAAPGIGECASRLETCRNKFEERYDIAPPPPCKCANFSKRCGPNEDLLRGYCWVDDSNYWWCPECSHYLWEELGTDYGYYVPPHLQYWIADKKEETPMATPSLIFEEELVQTIPSFRPSNAGVRSFPYPEVWLTLMGLAVRHMDHTQPYTGYSLYELALNLDGAHFQHSHFEGTNGVYFVVEKQGCALISAESWRGAYLTKSLTDLEGYHLYRLRQIVKPGHHYLEIYRLTPVEAPPVAAKASDRALNTEEAGLT